MQANFNSALPTPSESKMHFKARAKVVRLVHLYQFKFGEFFAKYEEAFFQTIWNLVE